jgi:uncharacterized protein with GYD domain
MLQRRCLMPKYLTQVSYTAEGAKGLLKEGGSKRRAAVEAVVKSVGGKVEAFYFGFGTNDAYVIVDAPDNASVAAVSLNVAASGAARVVTTVLLTPDEIDTATRITVSYQAPGR